MALLAASEMVEQWVEKLVACLARSYHSLNMQFRLERWPFSQSCAAGCLASCGSCVAVWLRSVGWRASHRGSRWGPMLEVAPMVFLVGIAFLMGLLAMYLIMSKKPGAVSKAVVDGTSPPVSGKKIKEKKQKKDKKEAKVRRVAETQVCKIHDQFCGCLLVAVHRPDCTAPPRCSERNSKRRRSRKISKRSLRRTLPSLDFLTRC